MFTLFVKSEFPDNSALFSGYNGPFSISLWIPILPIISFPLILLTGAITNPYRFQSNIHGSARLATGLSFGQTGGCPDWFMTAEHAKESIFEVMIFGTRQVVYYYNLFVEPLRMSKIVDALNAVTPFEDIIIEGKLADDVKASTKDLLLTHRTHGNESLLAVRSYYAEKDVTGTITFDKVNAEVNVYDAETGKIVGKVSPSKTSFTYNIAKKRCRLLYLGTAEQWKKRHE